MWRSQTLCSWWKVGQEEGCEEGQPVFPHSLPAKALHPTPTPAKKQSEKQQLKPAWLVSLSGCLRDLEQVLVLVTPSFLRREALRSPLRLQTTGNLYCEWS